MSPAAKSDKDQIEYTTKKCPDCYEHLSLSATECHVCKTKVGKVDKLGFAEKPADWQGYLIAFVAIVAFVAFVWWAFFLE